jgi:molybdenum cofactor cytidylyltransferase
LPQLIAPITHSRYDDAVLAAIILAAGDSTRMGRPKALLPDPEGRPFVARLVRTFHESGIPHIIVVTGSLHGPIADALAADDLPVTPHLVNNPQPALGQVSSLWMGLDAAVKVGVEGVLMTLVDIPFVRPSTVRRVVDTWAAQRALIVRPAVGARHGHPVLFDQAIFDALRHAPVTEGARAVVHANADRIVDVPVDDEGCLLDVDTPADYEALIRKP